MTPSRRRFSSAITCLLLCLPVLPSLPAAGEDWPSFRGPGARGVADGAELPASWNLESGENVRWRTALPGLAHSSPVIAGGRLFVTTAVAENIPDLRLGDSGGISLAADPGEYRWQLLAIDPKDGKVLWQKDAATGAPRAKRHVKSSQANATPATDGRTVVALLGSQGLFAFSAEGEPLWHQDLGVLDPGLLGDTGSQWGHGSSPILAGDRVIVQVDRHRDSFLAAYDLATGKQLWKVARDERPVWATPTYFPAGGRDELIVIGGNFVRGYRATSGEELWRFADQAEVKTPTPFVAGERVILAGGYRGRPLLALKAGGSGDLSEREGHSGALLWRSERGGPYTSTPVVYGDHVYAVTDTGVLTVYDLASGQQLSRQRTSDTYSASLVAGDGKVYLTGEGGTVTVLAAGAEPKVLAENAMNEPCFATPAIAGGSLYLRCRGHLYAIARTAEKPAPPAAPAR